MEWLLQMFVGQQQVRKLLLDLPEVTIGRSPKCHIRLPTAVVSRKHARLAVSSRHVIAEDLKSTNGVYKDGKKIRRVVLSSGDAFTIGPYRFLVDQVSFAGDIPRISSIAVGEDPSGRVTVFIDEEIKRKLMQKQSPFEETRLDDDKSEDQVP